MLLSGSLGVAAAPLELLKDINRGITTSIEYGKPTPFGAGWILTLCGSAGCAPWFTDGTPAGTHRIGGVENVTPVHYAVDGSQAYFIQSLGGLWRTDGTEAGTQRIDLPVIVDELTAPVALGGSVYFMDRGAGLWKSDGTSAGTQRLTASSLPGQHRPWLAVMGGQVYFTQVVFGEARQLWRTDGTPLGTAMVSDFGPGYYVKPEVVVASNKIYFVEERFGSHALWTSDGTPAGTRQLLVMEQHSAPVALNDSVYLFARIDGSLASTLYRSDGTPAGTLPVRDIPQPEFPPLTVVGSSLFFSTWTPTFSRALWRSDGTDAGTIVVKEGFSSSTRLLHMVAAGSTLYFANAGDSGVLWGISGSLWRSDGTEAGTMKVSDAVPFIPFASLGDKVLALSSYSSGAWISDGTPAGTTPLPVPAGESNFSSLCGSVQATFNGAIYFGADDGIHGCELWKTEGTAGSTVMVRDINPRFESGIDSITPFAVLGSHLYFRGTDGGQSVGLWRTDGTEAGTTFVKLHGDVANLTVLDNALFYSGGGGVWKSDGTPAGTELVKLVDTSIFSFTAVGNRLYFWSRPSDLRLWTSDGTTAGTVALKSFDHFAAPLAFNGRLFFLGTTPADGRELWESDGTAAGTRMIVDLSPGPIGGVSSFIGVLDGFLYFTGNLYGNTNGLWRTDGTALGTGWIAPADGTGPGVVLGNRLYFRGFGGLGVTDGTPQGTGSAADFCCTGPVVSLISAAGSLFAATALSADVAIWLSSGAAGGTALVDDSLSGPYSSEYYPRMASLPAGIVVFAGKPGTGGEPYFIPFDSVPDTITFPPKTNQPTDGWAVSDPLRVTGINVAVPVSSSGGQFCVSSANFCSCDLSPYGTSGTVGFGQYLCARHATPGTASTTTTTDLSIGGLPAAFASATGASNPPTLVFDQTRFFLRESGALSVPVYRVGSAAEAVSVTWQTTNGTAVTGQDFGTPGSGVPPQGVVSWAAGDATPKMITVGPGANIPIINDSLWESAETFGIALSNPLGGAVLGAASVATVEIRDEESVFSYLMGNATVLEVGSNVELIVRRTGYVAESASVSFRTVNGSAVAGSDFGSPGSTAQVAGVLEFPPGHLEKRISIGPTAAAFPHIPVIDDAVAEGPESFGVELFAPTNGGTVLNALATVNIASNESAFSTYSAAISVGEHSQIATVLVFRSGTGVGLASVGYATSNGTAIAGTHYRATSGVLRWNDGETGPKVIDIPILDNETSNTSRTFSLTLSSPTNAALGAPSSTTVTIRDNENTVQFTASSATITEGVPTLNLNVSRTGSTAFVATVRWSAINGTAISGVDFTPSSGTLRWEAGDGATKSISISIIDDTTPEPPEAFTVSLNTPIGTKLGAVPTLAVALNDNDAAFVFSAPTFTVPEGTASVRAQVQRGGPSSTAASVHWSTADGSAKAGKDFGTPGSSAQRSGTLSWLAGDVAPKSIVIPILQDVASEGPETFTVFLSAPSSGMVLGTPSTATVTITDDEIAAQSRISFVEPKKLVFENAGNAVVTVRREAISGAFTVPATVSFATVPGSALATSDYLARTGTLTWAVGDAADKTITVPIVNDGLAEAHEVFKITLAATTAGALVQTPEMTVTIIDDDETFPKFGAIPDGWTMPVGASAGWHVSNDPGAYEGVFSLRSDAIDDAGTSQVEVTRVFTAGAITFRVKVSSEAGFDKLRFFVDGVEKGTWSGTAVPGWQLVSVPITAGTRTLRWSYEKDSSVSMGQDAAWIDAVVLP